MGIARKSRNWKNFASFAAVLSLASGSVAFGVSTSASASTRHGARRATSKQLVVGFTNPTEAQPVLDYMGKGIIARAKRLGVKVVQLDDQLTITKQVSDINTLVGEHVNGIINFPLDTTAVGPAIASARKAGIAVVGIGVLKGTSLTYKPSATSFQAVVNQGGIPGGKEVGGYLAKALHDKGNFVAIGLSTPVPGVIYQLKQSVDGALRGHSGMHLLGEVYNSTDNETGGLKAMDEAIAHWGKKINGVIAYNDLSAIGAAIALKQNHMSKVVITGRNGDVQGVAAVKSGQISALDTILPWTEGATAMNLIYRLMKGTKHVPAVGAVNNLLYTKANIGKRLSWTKAIQELSKGKLVGKDAPSSS